MGKRERCDLHKSWQGNTDICRRCRADYQADYRKEKAAAAGLNAVPIGRPRKPLRFDGLPDTDLRFLQHRLYRAAALAIAKLKSAEAEMEARGMLFGVAPESSMLCRPEGEPD